MPIVGGQGDPPTRANYQAAAIHIASLRRKRNMVKFQVSVTRGCSADASAAKYLMRLHQETGQLERTVFLPFSDDAAFFEALAKLGTLEPEQQRILSVLHQRKTETVTVDVSGDVDQLLRWPVQN
jgi:hypothetical protein